MRLTALCACCAALACLVAGASAQKRCPAKPSPLTPGRAAGTDYAGPNISVSVVQSRDACCAECSENPKCTMAVWYNHELQLCALKVDMFGLGQIVTLYYRSICAHPLYTRFTNILLACQHLYIAEAWDNATEP
jgi:hypothetical protein